MAVIGKLGLIITKGVILSSPRVETWVVLVVIGFKDRVQSFDFAVDLALVVQAMIRAIFFESVDSFDQLGFPFG